MRRVYSPRVRKHLRVNPFCALKGKSAPRFFFSFSYSRLSAPRCTFHKERHYYVHHYDIRRLTTTSWRTLDILLFARRSTNCNHASIFLRARLVGDEKNDVLAPSHPLFLSTLHDAAVKSIVCIGNCRQPYRGHFANTCSLHPAFPPFLYLPFLRTFDSAFTTRFSPYLRRKFPRSRD